MFLRMSEAEHHELDARLLNLYRALRTQPYNYGSCAAMALQIISSIEEKLLYSSWREEWHNLGYFCNGLFVARCPNERHENYRIVNALHKAICELITCVFDRFGSETESAGNLPVQLIDAMSEYLKRRGYDLTMQTNALSPSTEKHSRRAKNINAKLLAAIHEDPTRVNWSARQFAEHLNCAKSSVIETATWNIIRKMQESERFGRSSDRSEEDSDR